MRIIRAFLALALALPASAAAPVRLPVPEVLLSAPAFSPAPLAPLSLQAPSLLPAPSFAQGAILLTPAPALRPANAPLILSAADILKPAPSASASASPDSGRFDAFFDGASMPAPADGVVVPRLLSAGQPTLAQPMHLGMLQSAVQRVLPALRESVALGSWNGPNTTLEESCCGDAAPKLAALLRASGVPARLVEAEFHYYVLLDLKEGQIIVDPTVRQFFGKKKAPHSIPQVFVGTPGELDALFRLHAASKTTRYDVLRIYFNEARLREDQLAQTEKDVRSSPARDLVPLRRVLGLPEPPPAKPEPPRLIAP